MRKPNFFIIGAPKCATTSIAAWLSEHPKIFVSPIKEPNFFNTDDYIIGRPSPEEYRGLFANASEQHIAIGEASASYLRSELAVMNILRYSDSIPKFIVCLRNPVEMAISLHSYLVQIGVEDEVNFEVAWRMQDVRAKEKAPLLRVDQMEICYGLRCKVGEQLERVYSLVDRSRVLVVFLDDIRREPRQEYRRVLQFLEVPDDGRQSFQTHNQGRNFAFPFFAKLGRLIYLLKSTFGIRGGLGIYRPILEIASTSRKSKIEISPQLMDEVREFFRTDVEKLSRLVGRDLRHWLD